MGLYTESENGMKLRIARILAGALVAGLAAEMPFAKEAEVDAKVLARIHTTLGQAVLAAEKHLHGRAVRAELNKQKDGSWLYDVEVVRGAKAYDVRVDPALGTIISAVEDGDDQDDDEDDD